MRALTFIMAISLASLAKAGLFEMPKIPTFDELKQKIPFMKDEKKQRNQDEEQNGGDAQFDVDLAKETI